MADGTLTADIDLPDTMSALVFDRGVDPWESSRGLRKLVMPRPRLDERKDPRDASAVIIRVLYSGFCGSDRGIWFRKAFRSMIEGSLDEEGSDQRITGHEMLGEIVEVGRRANLKYGYSPGEVVSTESHIVCGTCTQCRVGDTHVCAEDKIIGISLDGCFAEYIKLPAKALWRTDLSRIRPEVAAVQEPFGNAVHACTKVDLRGKSVAIYGTGTIGLFAVLVARGLGAGRIVGIEPNAANAERARRLGCDEVIVPDLAGADPVMHDPAVVAAVRKATFGDGADVSMEMAGFNSSLNNAIAGTRRGGDIILFGVRDGPMTIENYGRVIMNGLAMHAVVGRRIFETWTITRSLLEDHSNGIQDAIWQVSLNEGRETLVDIREWDKSAF
ncbi:MAG: alcohol dehydrogenase catalytic domain-containing protein, partial [Deltaproteobacteria bacterium]|nr:alcohol dehydrogenase catalytic domain-containing protein [Deltaproteobacteria bacterium]